MRFHSPEWFLILPLLLAAGWFWRGMKLGKSLRLFCLALVTLLLVQPEFKRLGDGLDLWVLVDQSDSASGLLTPKLPEWETILEKSRKPADRIHFVDFAGEAVTRGAQLRSGMNGQIYAGPKQATRLNSAAGYALA